MMPTLTWTQFDNANANTKREVSQEWADLIESLRNVPIFASKAVCPWIKLARFGSSATDKGSLRNNNNVLEITGVEGDYDGEKIQPEEAVSMLERAGIRACVYTSPSHRAEAPRWRVLAPLSGSLNATARTRMLARINGALGGVLSSESFTLSQSYYYGRVEGQTDYKVIATFDDPDDGEFIDCLDHLDSIAKVSTALPGNKSDIPPSHAIAAAVEHLGRRLRTGDSRRELLRRYISDRSRRGLDVDEIMSLVELQSERFFDPVDKLDVGNVRKIAEDFVSADYASGNSADVRFGRQEEAGTTPGAVQLLNLSELCATHKSISWSVKHVLPASSIGVLFGGSGTFKSFIALDLALHVAHGLPWLGRKTKRSSVIYIAAEGGAGLWKRIEAWHKIRKLPIEEIDFYVVVVALDLIRDASKVVSAARDLDVTPGLVIVDTMSQTFNGEENSANEVAGYLRELSNRFRAYWSACVMVIHHSGHMATERPRGSSAIRGNVDFMFGVFREEKQMIARLECHKQKDGDVFKELSFGLDSVHLSFDEDGDPVNSLVARYIESDEELESRLKVEATRAVKNTHERTALDCAQVGMSEAVWRVAFYGKLGDAVPQDTKKKAFQRVRDLLVDVSCRVVFEFDHSRKQSVIKSVNGTS